MPLKARLSGEQEREKWEEDIKDSLEMLVEKKVKFGKMKNENC